MSFKDLADGARQRERLMALGAAALADAERLALLLRTGIAGKNVLQLSQDLLDRFGGLSGLLHAGLDDLKQIKGLGGTAKRAELAAVLELSRRALAERLKERAVFDSPGAVAQYLQLHLAARPHEVFAVLFLDAQHRLIVMEELCRGTLTQTSVYPPRSGHPRPAAPGRGRGAGPHPSGSVEPSRADELLTQTLKAALALVDVQVLDHVIVARGSALSMAECGGARAALRRGGQHR